MTRSLLFCTVSVVGGDESPPTTDQNDPSNCHSERTEEP